MFRRVRPRAKGENRVFGCPKHPALPNRADHFPADFLLAGLACVTGLGWIGAALAMEQQVLTIYYYVRPPYYAEDAEGEESLRALSGAPRQRQQLGKQDAVHDELPRAGTAVGSGAKVALSQVGWGGRGSALCRQHKPTHPRSAGCLPIQVFL